MQRSFTARDTEGVVHALPQNWGVRSFKTTCGARWDAVKYPRVHYETEDPVTCLWCVCNEQMGGVIITE